MEENLNLTKKKTTEYIKENESFEESVHDVQLQLDDVNQSQIIEEKDTFKEQNKILEVETDKIHVLSTKKKEKEEPLTDRQQILAYERAHGDYEKYGVAFDLKHCRITAADSKDMKRIKTLLKHYLQLKQDIETYMKDVKKRSGRKKGNAGMDRIELIHPNDSIVKDEKIGVFVDISDIGMANRDELGTAYDDLMYALNTYDGGITLFKHGRGRKRLNQVRRVRELLEADNRKYWLSQERRMIKNSGGDDFAVFHGTKQWPTYSGLIRNKDMIADRMQNYKDRKRKGEKVRFWEGWGQNIVDFGAMLYHGAVGTVEMAAGIPLMLAGNAIKLTGKILKTPIHLVNGIFNQCCKWAGSSTRWRMDSFKDTWRKGWVNYEDGRKAYRNIVILGILFPLLIPLDAVFLELFQMRRLFLDKDDPHFYFLQKEYRSVKKVLTPHLRHLIKAMGITSKHYKDRAMLTAEEGGEYAHEWDNSNHDDDDEAAVQEKAKDNSIEEG